MERLETILRELREAVIACDSDGRILLYNTAAAQLFHDYETLGLGRSLFKVCARAPVEHALRMLKGRGTDKGISALQDVDTRFVCATLDGAMLLNCQISMIAAGAGHKVIFVLTFEDITRQVTETGRQGYLLDRMIRKLRAPITNLNAAADNLREYPDMAQEIKSDFEEVIIRESAELTRRFEEIVEEAAKNVNVQWPLSDVYSADLVNCVARRFAKQGGVRVTMTGVPLWLHADSFLMMLVLVHLVRFVRDTCLATEIDIETLLGDRRVYIDIVWRGEPIAEAEIDSVLSGTLTETVAGLTLGEVLARHDSEIWSQKHRRQGYALLRVPLPDSPRQWEVPKVLPPERPEFYDFAIAESGGELGEIAGRPLASLNYVVFDMETTGLSPDQGDEILSIAAVRIVNGRIISGERFERLIRPERPIPESAQPFLEITDEMVRDEPPAEVVLPQFRTFAADTVLVGHNPAIDMQFLEASGVSFKNPVLDTLLMTLIVDQKRTTYTLADISRWLGIDVTGSGTMIDDCFLTAQIFLTLLERLAHLGILTLVELLDASRQAAEEKRHQSG